MDSSAPSILPPWVRVPSTTSTLLPNLSLHCEKNESKQKEARFGPKRRLVTLLLQSVPLPKCSIYHYLAIMTPPLVHRTIARTLRFLEAKLYKDKLNKTKRMKIILRQCYSLVLSFCFCVTDFASQQREIEMERVREGEREKNFFHKAVICAKNYCLPHVWSFSYVALPCILIYIILPTYRPTYLLTYLPTCLLTYLLSYLPTYLLTYLLTYVLTFLLTYLPTYLPTYQPTYLLTYLPAY